MKLQCLSGERWMGNISIEMLGVYPIIYGLHPCALSRGCLHSVGNEIGDTEIAVCCLYNLLAPVGGTVEQVIVKVRDDECLGERTQVDGKARSVFYQHDVKLLSCYL